MGIALQLASQFQDKGMVKNKSRKHGFVNCPRYKTELLLIQRKTPNKQTKKQTKNMD